MHHITVTRPLSHPIRAAVGETVECDGRTARRLIAQGYARSAESGEPKAESRKPETVTKPRPKRKAESRPPRKLRNPQSPIRN